MLNSTVELITLWASSSPSLLAFCLSHVIIAVLLVGSRSSSPGVSGRAGERIADVAEPETADAAQGSRRNRGGEDGPVAATNLGSRGYAPDVNGHAGECIGGLIRIQESEENGGREEESIAAEALQERCGDEEDELMIRAEEFIQRMNRVWRTENVRVC